MKGRPGDKTPLARVLVALSAGRRLSAVAAAHHLEPASWQVLAAVHCGLAADTEELAETLGLTVGAVRNAVSALSQRGLLAESRQPEDRRRKRFKATPGAAALLELLEVEAQSAL